MFRVFLLMILVGAGCGPIEYVTTVTFQASRAVAQAKQARAESLAPYEYTIAVESLHKSRELAGHARWQDALVFGKNALDYGRKAESLAEEKRVRPDEK